MKRSVLAAFAVFIISFLFFSNTLTAQNTGSESRDIQTPNLGNLFEGGEIGLNDYYYIDQMSMQLVKDAPPLEKFINPGTYELGPYDLVSIEAIGNFSLRLRGVSINAQGDIILPVVGKVSINDLTISGAESKIQKQFNEEFKDTDISLSLDKPRPITVHVSGNISNPGNYLLPAGTRAGLLINMATSQSLMAGKNPQNAGFKKIQFPTQPNYRGINVNQLNQNFTGSREGFQPMVSDSLLSKAQKYDLRNVQIKRQDTVVTADMISYLRGGINKANPFLQDGDELVIDQKHQSTPRISISGSVISPVELSYNETDSIPKLLQISGGFTANADSSTAHIYRQGYDDNPITVDLNGKVKRELKPNDRVIIPSSDKVEETNSVWIHGAVQLPGNYPIGDQPVSISQLLHRAGGVKNDALVNGAYLIKEQYHRGPISPSTKFDPIELTRTSNMLLQGFDYMELEKFLGHNRVPVNLSNTEELEDLKMADGDHLYVPEDNNTIILFGQVNNPGYFHYNPQLTAEQYIQKAGGLAMGADDEEVFIIKAGSRAWYEPGNTQLESGDIIFVNRKPLQDFMAKKEMRQDRISLILSAVSTITAIITTTVAITQ